VTPEQAAAEEAVRGVAKALEVEIPPVILGILADTVLAFVAAMAGVTLRRAELAGLERASKVVDVASAEAAAVERNRE
jgi:ABC-type molybdate transport system permease subunit